MIDRTVAKLGPLGPMFLDDTQSFVAGMNAYITYLEGAGVTELPPEYATLALEVPPNFPPKPFTVNDIVANAVRSEEHTSELQSLMRISYAVFCLKKKIK